MMCRWLTYSGSPILLEELLYKPEHSLIDQSLHARLGVEPTNGDGFGVGWYDANAHAPAIFRSVEPAWNDRNLREVAGHVESPLFLAHIRASTGTPVQQTNCHPFRYGRWLWVHNGLVRDFPRVKRQLALAVDESLYTSIEGSTDSELLFFLALTLGLEDDPPGAVERMAGLVEEAGRRHSVEHPLQMTIATTDGESVWAFRYLSERRSRSLYYSTRCARCGRCTRNVHACRRCPTRHGLSSRNRLSTSPGPGTRCRNLATGLSAREATSCGHSGLGEACRAGLGFAASMCLQ